MFLVEFGLEVILVGDGVIVVDNMEIIIFIINVLMIIVDFNFDF